MTSQYYRSQINFILFLYFSRTQLLAYSLEKYLHLVLAPRSCFLILQTNNPNNRDNLPQIQQFLSPTRGITQIFAIFKPFPTYTISFLVETTQITQIFGIGHQPYSNVSNNTEYTLQLQASTQPIMLRTVLDHNPNALSTV